MASSKSKTMIPLIFIIIGSLVTVVAGFFDYRNKLIEKDSQLKNEQKRSDESEKLLNKSNDILIKTEGIIHDQQIVIDSSKKIIDLQKELAESYKKNADLEEDFKNHVTGGKTKPTLHLWYYKDGEAFIVNFDILNKGKYPLNNLKCLINDFHGIILSPFIQPQRQRTVFSTPDNAQKPEQEAYREWKPEHDFNIGALNVGVTYQLYATTLPLSNTYKGHILPYYTNGEGFYRVILEWNNGALDYFITVELQKEDLVLKEVSISFQGHPIDAKNVFQFR